MVPKKAQRKWHTRYVKCAIVSKLAYQPSPSAMAYILCAAVVRAADLDLDFFFVYQTKLWMFLSRPSWFSDIKSLTVLSHSLAAIRKELANRWKKRYNKGAGLHDVLSAEEKASRLISLLSVLRSRRSSSAHTLPLFSPSWILPALGSSQDRSAGCGAPPSSHKLPSSVQKVVTFRFTEIVDFPMLIARNNVAPSQLRSNLESIGIREMFWLQA